MFAWSFKASLHYGWRDLLLLAQEVEQQIQRDSHGSKSSFRSVRSKYRGSNQKSVHFIDEVSIACDRAEQMRESDSDCDRTADFVHALRTRAICVNEIKRFIEECGRLIRYI